MQWIKEIATGLIETYGTKDVEELLDYLEVIIIPKTFINPTVKARLYKDELEVYHIHISSKLDEITRKHVLCHELGHILLHETSTHTYYSANVNKGQMELQANYFASLLLVDPSSFDKCYLENLTIDQLSAYFEVPKELLQFTLDEMLKEC